VDNPGEEKWCKKKEGKCHKAGVQKRCKKTCDVCQAVVVGFNLGGTNSDYPGYGCLAGHNDETHQDKTLQQCKVACEDRLTCKSFDFYVGTHNCMLSDSNFEDVGSITATTDCRFYEKAALVSDGGRRLEDFAKVDLGLSKDFAVFTTTTTTSTTMTTSTTTTTNATTTSKASYHVVDGSNCGQGLEIVSSEACKAAADALDITYKRENMKGKWKHTPPGCFVHKSCTQGCALHFGTGNGNNNGNFRAICNVAEALPLFAFSESGVVDGCPADYSGIFEIAACKEAATYLGSGDRITSSSISSAYAGCYYNHKYAYFNAHPSPDGSFHEEHAGQICMLEHFFQDEL